MSTVITSPLLAAGLRQEFADTYEAIRNRTADSRLGLVMDLSVTTDTRLSTFGYIEAAPHLSFWPRGTAIPQDAMSSVRFTTSIYEWAKRIPWSKWDRKDEQTGTLMEMARMAGQSAALLPEIFFFDLLTDNAGTLPAVPNAPDGANFFATTAGGVDRFGISGGNVVSGTGVTTVHDVQADFYSAVERFKGFKDGQGQPMFVNSQLDQGMVIIHAAADTQIMEQAFLQQRQGIGFDDAGARGGTVLAAAAETNLVQDAARNVLLWGTSRLGTGDWYVFLRNPPKQPTFFLERQGIVEESAIEGENNSDSQRTNAEEYIQWYTRSGAGIALPYGAIQVDN